MIYRIHKGPDAASAKALVKAMIAVWIAATVDPLAVEAQQTPVNPPTRFLAVTFDDLPLSGRWIGLSRMRAMTVKLLGTIDSSHIPAVGFVNEKRLYTFGEVDDRIALLRMWLDAGLELGNHTFSHLSLQETPLTEYQDDVIRGETVTNMLLATSGRKIKFFRHPDLGTGLRLEVKSAFEQFLGEHGYTVAPVTIKNSDWMFALAYTNAKSQDDSATMKRVGRAYVEYTRAQFEFYEKVSIEVLGYQVHHILLLHVNELNGDYLGDLVGLIKERGYSFVSLDEALLDEAYTLPDTYAGPMGVSWLFRWDYRDGVDVNWREEPVPPEFIRELYLRR